MSSHHSRAIAREDLWDQDIILLSTVVIRRRREENSEVLLIHEGGPVYHNEWILPQGRPKKGETLLQAGRRECMEEVGLDINIDRLLGIYEDFFDDRHIVLACYLGEVVYGEIQPSMEAKDYVWIDAKSPPSECPKVVKNILYDYCCEEK